MGSVTIKKSLAFLIFVFGIALVVSNVFLARRVSHLQQIGNLLNTSNKLEIGATVPPLAGYDASGGKLTYSYGEDSRDTLVLAFSPGCRTCDENWPNWTHLIHAINSASTRVVLVNVAPLLKVTPEYLAHHDIGKIPLITEVSPESVEAYRMLYTPQTIVVGRDGKVRRVQVGVIDGKTFAPELACSPGSHCDATGAIASLQR